MTTQTYLPSSQELLVCLEWLAPGPEHGPRLTALHTACHVPVLLPIFLPGHVVSPIESNILVQQRPDLQGAPWACTLVNGCSHEIIGLQTHPCRVQQCSPWLWSPGNICNLKGMHVLKAEAQTEVNCCADHLDAFSSHNRRQGGHDLSSVSFASFGPELRPMTLKPATPGLICLSHAASWDLSILCLGYSSSFLHCFLVRDCSVTQHPK